MSGTIFDKLWKEYTGYAHEISRIDREIAKLQAKREVCDEAKTVLYGILTDYGKMVYEHYESKYTLTEKAEESAEC